MRQWIAVAGLLWWVGCVSEDSEPEPTRVADALVAALPSTPTVADPQLPAPLTSMSTTAIGKTDGRFEVTSGGAASYTIPIEVPPGRGGLQPSLRLAYNSHQKNGPLGVGWSLSGATSAITPCARKLGSFDNVAAVKWDASGDRLCLDGELLVAVSGSYNQDQAEYRTEHDSQHKIVQVGSPATHFFVSEKGGRILRYGKSLDCTSCNGYVKARVGARAWLLVEIKDRFQNKMALDYRVRSNGNSEDWDQDGTVEYSTSQQREGMEYYPITLVYGDPGQQDQRAVTLTWEARPDTFSGFFAGLREERTVRLKTIKTMVGTNVVRSYALAYSVDTSATGTGKSLLTSVTECSGSGDNVCKPSTFFEYSKGSNAFLAKAATSIVAPPPGLPESEDGSYPAVALPILSLDANDDGKADLVYPTGPADEDAATDSHHWTILKMGSNGMANATQHVTSVQATWPFAAVPIDYNQDSRMDVLLLDRSVGTWEVLLSNETGTNLTYFDTGLSGRVSVPMSPNTAGDLHRLIKVADLDGNGTPDLLTCGRALSGSGHRWSYRLHTGTGFGAEVELAQAVTGTSDCQPEAFFAMVLDADGDGASDLLIPVGGTYRAVHFNDTPRFTNTFLPSSVPNECTNTNKLRQVDVNHDGLMDVVAGMTATSSAIRLRYWLNMGGRFAGGSAGYAALPSDFGQYGKSLTTSQLIDHNTDGANDLLVNGDRAATAGCGRSGQPACPALRSGNWEVLVNSGLDPWSPTVKFTSVDTGLTYRPACASGHYCEDDLCVPTASLDCGSGYARGRAIDENGDLLPDLVFVENDSNGYGDDVFMYGRHAPGTADLLIKVRDGMVGLTPSSTQWDAFYTLRFAYQAATASAVYQPVFPGDTRSGCAWPVGCSRPTLMLVSGTWEDRGEGNAPALKTYDYYDARTHRPGRDFLGFARRVVTDGVTGQVTTLRYNRSYMTFGGRRYRHYPFIGTLSQVSTDVLQHNGKRLVTTHDYATHFRMRNGSQTYPFYTHRASDIATTTQDGTQLSRVVRTYAIDFHGNTTCAVVDWGGSGVTCANGNTSAPGTHTWMEAEYLDDESRWLIDGLTYALTTSRVGTLTQSKEVANYYDPVTGALTRTIDEPYSPALKVTTDFGHDAFGNVTRVATTDGLTTRTRLIDWDREGVFPYRFTNPLGHQSRVRFDRGLGVLLTEVDPNGQLSQLRYDGFGRLRQAVQPDGVTTTVGYSRVAGADSTFLLRTSQATTGGASLTQDFDRLGRVLRHTERGFASALVAVDSTWDRKGKLRSRTLPYFTTGAPAGSLSYTYDNLNRLQRTTYADGTHTDVTYDGLTATTYDTLGVASSSRTRNALGQTVRATTYGALTRYEYGPFGAIRTVQDPANTVTSIATDSHGQVTSIEDPNAGKRVFEYDRYGQRNQSTDALGATTKFVFDLVGRLTTRVDSEGGATYEYDAAPFGLGRLSAVSRGVGHKAMREKYSYDSVGRLSKIDAVVGDEEAAPLSFTKGLGYDALGRLSSLKIQTPEESFELGYAYDVNGHLTHVNQGASPLWTADRVNAAGQLEREVFSSQHVTNRAWDPTRGWLDAVSTSGPTGNLVQSLSYERDARGMMIRRSDAIADQYERFEYSPRRQLEKAFTCAGDTAAPCSSGETLSRHYQYDGIGNMVWDNELGTHTYDPAHPQWMTSAGGGAYGYDRNGNTIARPGMTLGYTSFEKLARASVTAGAFPSDPGRPLKISNDASGKCIQPAGESGADGAPITQSDCNAGVYTKLHQLWALEPVFASVPDGVAGPYYQLVNKNSGKCLTVQSALPSEQSPLVQLTCAQGPNHSAQQLWWLRPIVGSRAFSLVSKSFEPVNGPASGYCAEVPGGATDDSTKLRQNKCSSAASQRFGFDAPPLVTELKYDAFQNRTAKLGPSSRTTYALGMVEREVVAGVVTTRLRVKAMGRTVGVITRTGADTSYAFLHTDHLGSANTTSVLSSSGVAQLTRYAFEPFGQARAGTWTAGYPRQLAQPMTGAGFTGHGHDDALGLIDMKGRMYDARIGRFLSADPAVQAPWDARSFNRYSYAWNNPLVMTDPTGYNACPDDPYVSGCDDAGNTTGETTVWGEGASESSYGDPECNDIDCGGVGEDEGMSVEDNLPEDGISEDDSGADGLGDGYFIVSPTASPEFRAAVQEAMVYLREAGWTEEFDAAASGMDPIVLYEGKDDAFSTTHSLTWNPFSALKVFKFDSRYRQEWTGVHPPAIGLAHELSHALGYARDTWGFFERAQPNNDAGNYSTFEEKRVIDGPEKDLSDALGLGTRNNHGGLPLEVGCPTCVE